MSKDPNPATTEFIDEFIDQLAHMGLRADTALSSLRHDMTMNEDRSLDPVYSHMRNILEIMRDLIGITKE